MWNDTHIDAFINMYARVLAFNYLIEQVWLLSRAFTITCIDSSIFIVNRKKERNVKDSNINLIKDQSRIMRWTVRAACTVRLLFRLRNFFQEPDNKHFSHWIINSFSRATRRENYDVKSTSLVPFAKVFLFLLLICRFLFFYEKHRLNFDNSFH